MPDGGGKAAKLHESATLHLRTLTALHDSFFAPQFRALETYGDAAPPPPSLADVIAAAKSTLAWHCDKEIEVAAELAQRRAGGGHPALIDDAARALAHHRAERERIAAELTALDPLSTKPSD